MNDFLRKAIVLSGCLMGSNAANAVPVVYDFTGSGTLYTFTGVGADFTSQEISFGGWVSIDVLGGPSGSDSHVDPGGLQHDHLSKLFFEG